VSTDAFPTRRAILGGAAISVLVGGFSYDFDAQGEKATWKLVNNAAPWKPRQGGNIVSFADQLWLLGGSSTADNQHFRDIWSSRNGVDWTKQADVAEWKNAPSKMVSVFQERLWLVSGRQVWCSLSGKTWELVTEQGPWSYREGASLVSFRDRLFLLGGFWPLPDGSKIRYFNDVWSSGDGKVWELAQVHCDWRERSFQGVTVFNDALALVGGGRWETQEVEKDVWSSFDGRAWSRIRSHLPSLRFSPSPTVYRGALWILGTSAPGPTTQLLYSWDGKWWHVYRSKSQGSVSPSAALITFRDKLWAISAAGEKEGAHIWSMAIPANWSGNWFREGRNRLGSIQ